jgi:hypothetical protein
MEGAIMKALKVTVAVVVGIVTTTAHAQPGPSPNMSFFVTSSSPGKGGDLGGLEGADRHCQDLARAVDAGSKTWRAYLSTQPTSGTQAVNAKDRIGSGPWYNSKGVEIATNLENLHSDSNKINKETALDEKGNPIPGRGDTPNHHDILTGSEHDGTAFSAGEDKTCHNWTSSTEGSAVGIPILLCCSLTGELYAGELPFILDRSRAAPGADAPIKQPVELHLA